MRDKIDNHTHIILANIKEMIAAAKTNGIAKYSITEHVSQFKELRESVRFGSLHSSGRIFNDLEEYTVEFERIGRLSLDMQVSQGLEVDFAQRFESKVAEFVNQRDWDILLCSVHEFDNVTDIETTVRPSSGREEVYVRWREYLQLEKLALESDFVPFDVLAHPVRMSRGQATVPPDIDAILLELAKTASKRNKALELNGADIEYAPHLVRRLAQACSNAECNVSLGSDAHYPKDVFRNLEVAAKLVDEFKLKTISYGTSSINP